VAQPQREPDAEPDVAAGNRYPHQTQPLCSSETRRQWRCACCFPAAYLEVG